MQKMIYSAEEVWNDALCRLRSKSESLYSQWFAQLVVLELDGYCLHLGVSDDFFRDVIMEEYGHMISEALTNVKGIDYTFELIEGYSAPAEQPAAVTTPQKEVAAPAAPVNSIHHSPLHDYAFSNFIVGDSNRHAFAAAKAVAEAPGMNYNPLFLYGTNGVGKTHLLQAVAGELRATRNQLVIKSVSCDEMLNDYYDLVLKKRSFSDFRASLRDVDVLLIDDIHRLAKKTQMQEEFFNIFNILYCQNKQIVLTSDRQPCEISDLDKRLSSRFEQGMTCEVGMLEYEERLVTLRMWRDSSLTRPKLSDKFLDFLAENISSNVRRLKGCYLRLSAYMEMSGCDDMSISEAEELLHAQLAAENSSRDISPEAIQQAVARHFGINVPEIVGTRRTRQAAEPRMVAMYLCRELTKLSSNEIGDAFGRTHANVLHAAKTIAKRCEEDEEIRRSVTQLRRQLQKR